VRTETVTRPVPFRTITQDDPDLDQGQTRLARRGKTGRLQLVYRVSYQAGRAVRRDLVGQRLLRPAVNSLVQVGIRTTGSSSSDCDPNYTGACVPIASDVDYAGGSGNGPEYVEGPVTVVGDDIYGLDRDQDGIGCE
jgi:resuscitation-promoting factor RpfB